jgi:hypothetical protein
MNTATGRKQYPSGRFYLPDSQQDIATQTLPAGGYTLVQYFYGSETTSSVYISMFRRGKSRVPRRNMVTQSAVGRVCAPGRQRRLLGHDSSIKESDTSS